MENNNEDISLILDASTEDTLSEDNTIDYTSYIDSVESTLLDIHSELVNLNYTITDMQSDLKVCGIGIILVTVVLCIWGVFRW